MKKIDIENWNGRKHYYWFKNYSMPYYGFTSKMDCTKFYNFIKANKLPFYATMIYVVTKALNRIPEFRLRMIGDEVYDVELINPAFTIMTDEGVYDNCECEYNDDFKKFLKDCLSKIEQGKKQVNYNASYNSPRYDQIYITTIPWISLSNCSHPMTNDVTDCFPRIVWDKVIEENDKKYIDFSIQVNHCVCDGYPLSLGFIEIQKCLENIETEIIL